MINITQINVGKRGSCVVELTRRVKNNEIDICMIQEMQTSKDNNIKGIEEGIMYHAKSKEHARAAIWIKKTLKSSLKPLLLNQFTTRDITALEIQTTINNNLKKIVLISAYFPHRDKQNKNIDNPIDENIINLINYCTINNLGMILAIDANAHSFSWHENHNDNRGDKITDLIITNNLSVLNRGNMATFTGNSIIRRPSIIDITLADINSTKLIRDWTVDIEMSGSDHRIITYKIEIDKTTETKIRMKKKTDWVKYNKIIEKEANNLKVNLESVEKYEETCNKLTEILNNTFKKCCREKTIKIKNNNDWYNEKLDKERKKLNSMLKKVRKIKHTNPGRAEVLFALYKENQRLYNNNIRKAKFQSWKKKMEEIDNTTDTAKLVKLANRGPAVQLNNLMKQDGTFTKSHEESFDLLMKTHFQDCNQDHIPDLSHYERNKHEANEEEIEQLLSETTITYTIKSLSPYKTGGKDNIFPAMLQKALPHITHILKQLFKYSLVNNYIPRVWRLTNIIFIPKPGKENYYDPKSFRPISLMSFLLKTLEKIVESSIRDNELIRKQIHPNQHAYMPGKGCDSALNDLASIIEKNMNSNQTSILTSIDVAGAFDNPKYSTIDQALESINTRKYIRNWIQSMLKNRCISLDNDEKYYNPTKGCPQGSTISPLLWLLIINPLIIALNNKSIICIAYADDLIIIVIGPKHDLRDACDRMNNIALKEVEKWSKQTGLEVNPNKSQVMIITTARKIQTKPIKYKNIVLNTTKSIKFLGINFDDKHLFRHHLDITIASCKRTLWAARYLVGKTWGISVDKMIFIYNQIVIPKLCHGAIVFWHKTLYSSYVKNLEQLQRMAALAITGCSKTTPTMAIEAIINLLPIDLHIQEKAFNCKERLSAQGLWKNDGNYKGHKQFERLKITTDKNMDICSRITNQNKHTKIKTIAKSSENWNKNISWRDNASCWITATINNNDKIGISFYNPTLKVSKKFRISTCNRRQAELTIIEKCLTECKERNTIGKKLIILVGCNDTIKTLNPTKIQTKTSSTCHELINKVGVNNSITIAWRPGQNENVEIDQCYRLAYEASNNESIDIIIPTAQNSKKQNIKNQFTKEAIRRWEENGKRMKHSYKRINKPFDPKSARVLTQMKRKDLRTCIAALTGHAPTRNFLKTIGKLTKNHCRICNNKNEPETIEHLYETCTKSAMHRHNFSPHTKLITQTLITDDNKKFLSYSEEAGISKIINHIE